MLLTLSSLSFSCLLVHTSFCPCSVSLLLQSTGLPTSYLRHYQLVFDVKNTVVQWFADLCSCSDLYFVYKSTFNFIDVLKKFTFNTFMRAMDMLACIRYFAILYIKCEKVVKHSSYLICCHKERHRSMTSVHGNLSICFIPAYVNIEYFSVSGGKFQLIVASKAFSFVVFRTNKV